MWNKVMIGLLSNNLFCLPSCKYVEHLKILSYSQQVLCCSLETCFVNSSLSGYNVTFKEFFCYR